MITTKQSGFSTRLYKVYISAANYYLARGIAEGQGISTPDQYIDEHLTKMFKEHPKAATVRQMQERHREELKSVFAAQEEVLP